MINWIGAVSNRKMIKASVYTVGSQGSPKWSRQPGWHHMWSHFLSTVFLPRIYSVSKEQTVHRQLMCVLFPVKWRCLFPGEPSLLAKRKRQGKHLREDSRLILNLKNRRKCQNILLPELLCIGIKLVKIIPWLQFEVRYKERDLLCLWLWGEKGHLNSTE